jgi:hypothetical protein
MSISVQCSKLQKVNRGLVKFCCSIGLIKCSILLQPLKSPLDGCCALKAVVVCVSHCRKKARRCISRIMRRNVPVARDNVSHTVFQKILQQLINVLDKHSHVAKRKIWQDQRLLRSIQVYVRCFNAEELLLIIKNYANTRFVNFVNKCRPIWPFTLNKHKEIVASTSAAH